MTFNLIEKLKTELNQLKADLKGYSQEAEQLSQSRANAITDANNELQRAIDTFDRKLVELNSCIGTINSAIEQYEYSLSFLQKIEGKTQDVG